MCGLEFFGCGFARVAVKHSFTNPKVEYDQDIRLKKYLTVFEGHLERYEVDKHSYDKRSKSLVHHFGKWKLKTNKDKYTEHFSPSNWEKTERLRKEATHSHKLRGLLYSSLSFSIFISHVEFQRNLYYTTRNSEDH